MVPENTSPRWKELAAGKRVMRTDNLGLQMMLKPLASRTASGDRAEIEKAGGELYAFFTKYQRTLSAEIAALK